VRSRLAAEGGITLVELIIVCALLGVVSIGIVNMLVSGQRAQRDTTSRVNAQQSTRLAIDKLEYEARCASQISSLNSGAGVALVLPSWCSHATGTVSWCVTSGTLTRYPASTCTGTGAAYVRSVTSAKPFTVKWATSTTGYLPRLQISMTVNDTNATSNAFTMNETLSLRNGGMQISSTSGSPGSSVTITGTGMAPSTALTISFGSLAATITSGATTTSSGAVAATITVPFSGDGTYPITVSDGTTVVAASSRYTVISSFDGLMVTSATQSDRVLSCGNVGETT